MEELLKKTERSKVYLITDEIGNKQIKRIMSNSNADVFMLLKDNPNNFIPQICSVSSDENSITVMEEYIDGKCISETCFNEKKMLAAAKELCHALIHIHGLGIIHRDIKPSNIMLAPDGHIRLIDFDAARIIKPQADSDTRCLGTDGFAPPEQYGFSQTNIRSDIYAYGKTLECILGSLAFDKKYEKIIRKCTRLDPDERYANAGEILKELNGNSSHIPIIAVSAAAAVIIAFASVFIMNNDNSVPASVTESISSETTASLSEESMTSSEYTSQSETIPETEPPESETTTETTSAAAAETSISSETAVITESTGESTAASEPTETVTVSETKDKLTEYSKYYKNLDVEKAFRITPEEKATPHKEVFASFHKTA